MPREMRSLEDGQRLHHLDLPCLSDDDLAREGRCARQRADLDRDSVRRTWFIQRVEAVGVERTRRRSTTVVTTPQNDYYSYSSPRGKVRKEQSRRPSGVQVIGGKVVTE